jgi:hypothetical protein
MCRYFDVTGIYFLHSEIWDEFGKLNMKKVREGLLALIQMDPRQKKKGASVKCYCLWSISISPL